MSGFILGFIELSNWFRRHDIDTAKVMVVINIRDARAAAEFDAALQRELAQRLTRVAEPMGVRLSIAGLDIQIESPIHTP